ncbi:MAG: ImmA/IrrE family metallo-endopeptidase [Verrucomicrobiales bacterium]|nr:ImmA/IrrE family metallo-endopeptidase [Verrucomicrobiales bacterium]
MIHVAGSAALDAIQEGWTGPPFDPFRLAEILKIKTIPREDVKDARTVPTSSGGVQIEYNPTRPQNRIRFSIAHEIAHTFFPDCSERVRYRGAQGAANEWELEILCNIGAAELLMPTGSLPDLKAKTLAIEGLLGLRKEYQVSTESLALRYITATEQPGAIFVASRNPDPFIKLYHLDYAIGSRTWPTKLQKGFPLPEGTAAEQCTAIGFIAKTEENWGERLGKLNVECVGLPPYSHNPYPRVLGLVHPRDGKKGPAHKIRFVVGDATRMTGTGPKILAHVVNDKTPNWGAGFGLAVRKAFPAVQEEFRDWALKDRSRLKLGNVFITQVSDELHVTPMVCQKGYGPSEKPRIRYAALNDCLHQVMAKAAELRAEVHMPRIGSGEAGGSWGLIEQLVDENLCRHGVDVTVYEFPGTPKSPVTRTLFD